MMKIGKTSNVVSQEVLRISKEIRELGGIAEEKLCAKCQWEHMTRSEVIKCWGDPRNWD